MAADASDSIRGFRLTREGSASPARSAIEDEVVSLYDQLRAPVLRYVLSFRIPVPDAEELVQEVFLAFFQHLRRGKPRENVHGWIFRVAHNLALKRRLQARRNLDVFDHSQDPTVVTADTAPGPEEAAAARQRQQRLLAVVRVLPEQDQWCLFLRAEGLRYREIAEVLGISLGSVAASLERSLSRLTRSEKSEGTL